MAITLIGQERTGSGAIRKQGKKLVYEETYSYKYLTDDLSTTRLQILSAGSVPRVGVTLSAGGFAVCQAVDANRQESSPFYWIVTAQFTSEIDDDNSGASESQSGDPTAWVPLAQLSYETYTEVSFTDVEGVAFANSADLPFSSGIPLVRTLTRYEFEQFEPGTLTDDDIADRNETINETSFKGRDPQTLKLTVKDATIGYYYGYRCWRVSYSMLYKPTDWKLKVLDVGSTYKSGADLLDYLNTDGSKIVGFLNGSGAKSTTPTTIEFDQYETSNFNSFLRVT